MAFEDLPLVGMLKNRMRWLEARQKVLAENVANSATPGYRAHDLEKPDFRALLGKGAGSIGMVSTSPMHIGGVASGGAGGSAATFDPRKASTFETTPDRNSVVLEDEMMKVAETQQDFQLVTTLYSKSLSMIKLAVQRR